MNTFQFRPLLGKYIGLVIRSTREAQGRSLSAVAAASFVSKGYISEIERGEKEASSETLIAISWGLRTTVEDLVESAILEMRAARLRAESAARSHPRPLQATHRSL